MTTIKKHLGKKHCHNNWKSKAVELGEILTEIRLAMKYKCYKDVITLLNDADKIKETK